MTRALQIRVTALEREQAEAACEFESLHERGNDLLAAMQERQTQLRTFRALLLNEVRA